MRRLDSILLLIALLAASACTVHSVRTVEQAYELDTVVGRGLDTQVKLISETGESTGWLPSSALVMSGNMLCVRATGEPWSQIQAVRVTDLTDANIANILVGLPRSIRVVHLGNGEARLETDGEDLSAWLGSAAHDRSDVRVQRYHVMVWDTWFGPLTWRQLGRAARPMLGWPISGTSAQLRDVDAASSALLTAIAAPAIVLAAGVAVAGRVSSPLPSDQPPRPRGQPRATDAPLELVGVVAEAQRSSAPGAWRPRACNLRGSREAQP